MWWCVLSTTFHLGAKERFSTPRRFQFFDISAEMSHVDSSAEDFFTRETYYDGGGAREREEGEKNGNDIST